MKKLNKTEVGDKNQSKISTFLLKKSTVSTREEKPQNNKLINIKEQAQLIKAVHSNNSPEHSISSSLSHHEKNSSHSPKLTISRQKEVDTHKEVANKINVLFYLNNTPSQPYGEFIDKMHEKWAHDYQRLERDHSFIQWIFPNSFQSRFNRHAQPLTEEEAQQFRTNPLIYNRYIKSYEMMLAFYGFKLKSRATGELVRSRKPDYKQRFYKTLTTSFHNHMRITRILTSLKETGFASYALELCKILKYQIYNLNGAMNSLKKYNVYKQWEAIEHQIKIRHCQVNLYFETVIHHKLRVQEKIGIEKDSQQYLSKDEFNRVDVKKQLSPQGEKEEPNKQLK